MTSADAQAFKRACSCFGLGRYFYDVSAIWVDLDQNRQPSKTPVLSAWALPENWRKGIRPRARNSDGKPKAEVQDKGPKKENDGGQKKAINRRDGNKSESGHGPAEKSNASSATNSAFERSGTVGPRPPYIVSRRPGKLNAP